MSEYVFKQGVPLAYGGGIFNLVPATSECISGYFLGTEVAEVTQMVDRLLSTLPPIRQTLPVSLKYTQTLVSFIQNEAVIVRDVASAMQAEQIEPVHLEVANANLTQMVASALRLGDLNLLDHSIPWLNGLLTNRGFSTSMAMQFYATYRQVVERYLGDEGGMILDWLVRIS